ncbi:chorismate mutase [Aquabacter spiritensis]|uniref:chorismate mutase n=1 Tax=Aquabacter spiritensis TaxID=933073 RepID=A0A4R3LZ10_9HYPH|nr:chorismate mutase [Aquabacter spiritensis]TCT05912.1 chorismate mutase [Aquabacter spiritensis]
MNAPPSPPDLAALRAEIDRIDEHMHRLLMERGEIIDRLVAVKRSQGGEGGSAFRPAREAAMMRRLVDRHGGLLPLDTVESIWRVIISTFTYVQAPYAVHADLSAGEPTMRDSARFHFGFTTPFVPHMGPRGVIEAVAASRGDLGLLPAAQLPAGAAWWHALEGADAPKIIARLPFVERADHPAGLPVFVVSHPIADAAVTEIEVWSVRASGWSARAAAVLGGRGTLIAAARGLAPSLLLSVQAGACDAALAALAEAGAQIEGAVRVGSHAEPYRFGADAA